MLREMAPIFAGTFAGTPIAGLGKQLGTMGVAAVTLAEAVRFELTEVVKPRQFSRLLHSTALPSFL
jgi:hypothetical protein